MNQCPLSDVIEARLGCQFLCCRGRGPLLLLPDLCKSLLLVILSTLKEGLPILGRLYCLQDCFLGFFFRFAIAFSLLDLSLGKLLQLRLFVAILARKQGMIETSSHKFDTYLSYFFISFLLHFIFIFPWSFLPLLSFPIFSTSFHPYT